MKVVILFLSIFLVLPIGAFAESFENYSSVITLEATVPESLPDFKIYGSTDSSFSESTVGGGGRLEVANPAESDVTAYFKLTQSNVTRYKGDFEITFTPSALSTTTASGEVYSTALPTASFQDKANVDGILTVAPASSSDENHQYSANVSYHTEEAVDAGTDIITVGYQWNKDSSLYAGFYTGSVAVKVVSLN